MSISLKQPLPPPPPPWTACTNITMRCLQAKKDAEEDQLSACLRVGRKAMSFQVQDSNFEEIDKKWFLCGYRRVTSILQDGPQCGFAAIQIVQSLLSGLTLTATSLDAMIRWAMDQGFTKQGEMFSADYMKCTVEEFCGLECSVLDLEENSGQSSLLRCLLQGIMVVIAYDDDKNHTPCLKRGHKAHWAVLTGFFLVLNDDPSLHLKNLVSDHECRNLYHCQGSADVSCLIPTLSSECVFVYGHHGKSSHAGIWRLTDLLASNANLVEVDPDKSSVEDDYVIAPEGIAKELRFKALIIRSSTGSRQS